MSETIDTEKTFRTFLDAIETAVKEANPVAVGVVMGLSEPHDGGNRVRMHAVTRLPAIEDGKELREFAVVLAKNLSGAVANEVARLAGVAAMAAIEAADTVRPATDELPN